MKSRPEGVNIWNLAYRLARRYYKVDPGRASEVADLATDEFFGRIAALCDTPGDAPRPGAVETPGDVETVP